MKYLLTCLLSLLFITSFAQIQLPTAKFITGDNKDYSNTSFDDSKWITLKANKPWDEQGFEKYDGFGWYRFHVTIPSSLKTNNPIRLTLGKADDASEVFFNGVQMVNRVHFPAIKEVM
ncbi:MAG: hypothetical protein WDM90_19955 [Ferruginibacter sp.]